MASNRADNDRRKRRIRFEYTGTHHPGLSGKKFSVSKLASELGLSKTCLWNRIYARGLNPENGVDDEFLSFIMKPRKRGAAIGTSLKTPRIHSEADPELREAAAMLKYNSLPIFTAGLT